MIRSFTNINAPNHIIMTDNKLYNWINNTKIFNTHTANKAAVEGRIDVLEWLAEKKNIYPNRYGADRAAMMDQLPVLRWLADHGIHVTKAGEENAKRLGHTSISKWISEYYNYLDRDDLQLDVD